MPATVLGPTRPGGRCFARPKTATSRDRHVAKKLHDRHGDRLRPRPQTDGRAPFTIAYICKLHSIGGAHEQARATGLSTAALRGRGEGCRAACSTGGQGARASCPSALPSGLRALACPSQPPPLTTGPARSGVGVSPREGPNLQAEDPLGRSLPVLPSETAVRSP